MPDGDQKKPDSRDAARDRHALLGRLFAEATELDPASRRAFLDDRLGGDPSLRAELEALLRAAATSGVVAAIEDGLEEAAAAVPKDDEVAPASIGHYRIDGELGKGGMGVVYLATDRTLGRQVALKLLPRAHVLDPHRARRLESEARAAAALNHPGIVTLHSLEWEGDRPFLTMEYVEGIPLDAPDGGMAEERWFDLATQLADAVGAAHRARVVHRDLKPHNVVITPEGRLKVCDFGLAKLTGSQPIASSITAPITATAAGSLVGTIPYMSPEQARGDEVDVRSDVFSLGVLLWEMATGRRPFAATDPSSLVAAILRDDAPLIADVRPDFDPRASDLVASCLVKDLAQRLPSADVLHRKLVELRAERGHASARSTASTTSPIRRSLPAEADAFVARDAEIAAIAGRFAAGSRLVTLLGPGGMGKTRLAVHFGHEHADDWPGGVWFLDLTEARSLDGAAAAAARGLDAPLGKGDPMRQIGAVIAGRGRCLVIADNFESVVELAHEAIGAWIEAAPAATFVVTSRIQLGLPGEDLFELAPLDRGSGIELFERRARERKPSFEVTTANRDAVRAVVDLVDGVPLAIELAAARIRVLSPAQIRDRLTDQFRLLSDSTRKIPRQATMRATIDWSWNALEPWEQAALAQASTFVGGMTIEAAEAVIDLEPWPESPPVLDVIERLLACSLLHTTVAPTAAEDELLRFGMYTAIHTYAAEKLRDPEAIATPGGATATGPEAAAAADRRHADWFAQLGAPEAIAALNRHGGLARTRRLDLELENLVAACRRSMERGDRAAVGAYRAAAVVLARTGPVSTRAALARDLLDHPDCLAADDAAYVHETLGQSLWRQGEVEESRSEYETALAHYRETEDRGGQGRVLNAFALLLMEQGERDQARSRYLAALELSRAVGDRRTEALAIGNLANLLRVTGETRAARAHYEQAVAIHRELGSRISEGNNLNNLGLLHIEEGNLEAAIECLGAALAIHLESGNRRLEAATRGNLCSAYASQGRLDAALQHGKAALAIATESGDRRFLGTVSGALGGLYLDREQAEQALPHLETALRAYRAVGERRYEGIALRDLGRHHHATGRHAEARACFAKALAIHGDVGDRRNVAIARRELAKLHVTEGKLEEATAAFAEAERVLRELRDKLALADLLCARGACDLARGDQQSARAAQEESGQLAEASGAGPDSVIARAVSDLSESLAAR